MPRRRKIDGFPNKVGADGSDIRDMSLGKGAPASLLGSIFMPGSGVRTRRMPSSAVLLKDAWFNPGLTGMDPRRRPAESGTKGVKRASNTVLNPRGVHRVLHPVAIYQAEPVRGPIKTVAARTCRSDLILELAQDKIGIVPHRWTSAGRVPGFHEQPRA